MAAERNAFKLGLTMIVFLVLLVGVLVFLAPTGGDMTVHVRFPHDRLTTVLKPGGMVRCGGKTVGGIRSVDLQEHSDAHAPDRPGFYSVVTIRVDSGLGLRHDCRIIPVAPLLGEGGQLIVQDRGNGEVVHDGEQVEGHPCADLAALMQTFSEQMDPEDPASLLAMIRTQIDPANAQSLVGKIHQSLDDINAMTQSISGELDAGQKTALLAKLHAIMDYVNDTTRMLRDQMDPRAEQTLAARLHQTLDTLHQGLETTVAMLQENREPITRTIAHVHKTSEILEEQIAARIAAQLDVSDAASLLAKVHASIDRLGGSLEHLDTITVAAEEMVVLNREQIDRMVANFKETSDHLNAAAKEIRSSPWRLLYQPPPEELAEANILASARTFSEAAARLDAASARLTAFETVYRDRTPAQDAELLKIREALQQTFEDFTAAEKALWDRLRIR